MNALVCEGANLRRHRDAAMLMGMPHASRRALTLLHLFEGEHPGWLVQRASFDMRSTVMMDGLRWQVGRGIAATDAGLWASVSMSPSCTLTTNERRRVGSNSLAHLRRQMDGAGFEDRCTLSARFTHAFFLRDIPTLRSVAAEWRFLENLSVSNVMRGGGLALRRQRPTVAPKDVDGRANRLFGVLREDAVLMSHLRMLAWVRIVRERIGPERWTGRLRLVGDPFCIQAVVQFQQDGLCGQQEPSRTYDRISRAMKQHGYEAVRRIAFSKVNLGPVSLRREKEFLGTLQIRDMVGM